MDKPLTIGHTARTAGVNVETIRYYQRVGILVEPAKPVEGYRIYPSETVGRIRFIKRAQQLGFSLQEITELLELGDGHCDDVRHRAEEKRTIINQQIKDLQKLRGTLDNLIQACQCDGDTRHCPIVETLAGK
ncbi:MAG: MerR family DNA-binding protein [Gammaproteobacteria bacterium]|nr:MerR family DNA-binding protein [Gammaproteobacteria bacterium]